MSVATFIKNDDFAVLIKFFSELFGTIRNIDFRFSENKQDRITRCPEKEVSSGNKLVIYFGH